MSREYSHDSDQDLALAIDEHLSRTPRPYFHDGEELQQDIGYIDGGGGGPDGREERLVHARREWQQSSGQDSLAGSESGTEADDERPSLVKALPSSSVRLRKGLKTGEENEDALLTPSQLDEQERRVQGYLLRQKSLQRFPGQSTATDQIQEDEKAVQEKVLKRRFAEFVRRISEVVLMGFILVCVLCGNGVLQTAYIWWRELLSHVGLITALILAYPFKLSIVDTQARHTKLWQRFRVPASFDPATVLYPPLLPVLVALSVAPANGAVIMPNLVLGLASLPQRLFPRSSRLGGLNAVHWLISIVPLIVSQNTAWPMKTSPALPYSLKTPGGLSPETLVSLYPLHHALLQPLQYLTTTSLLVTELHLLSVSLINLLLLAESPQAYILKACLWIGGVCLLITCAPILHWNVTLARVPRWKLRRPGHTAEERKSLVDAVSELITMQRATAAFNAQSDADEDEHEASTISSKEAKNSTTDIGRTVLNTAGHFPLATGAAEPSSAVEPRHSNYTYVRDLTNSQQSQMRRPRSSTMPVQDSRNTHNISSERRRSRSSPLLWCLQLTPDQAHQRKWLYAGCVYLAIVAVIIAPVREYVSRKALQGQEPIGWALGYMIGQVPFVRSTIDFLELQSCIPLPNAAWSWHIPLTIPLHVDLISLDLGPANVRLLLIVYWVAVLLVGLLAVFNLTAYVEVDTRRKVFHGVMVAMLLPATFVDPCYCALALSLVLAVFLLLEVIRAGQVPPLGNAIGRFVAPYVDGRDLRGPVVVSHIFLLIGCAVPLWFSLASIPREGEMPWVDWELLHNRREVAMVAGVVCVGMGDAAASLIGRRYGRRKWIWVGGKSLEGSAAFAVAVTFGLMGARMWQALGGWNDHPVGWNNSGVGSDGGHYGVLEALMANWGLALLKAAVCACGASFMEAVLTGANDNVVVPVALWLLVKGLRI